MGKAGETPGCGKLIHACLHCSAGFWSNEVQTQAIQNRLTVHIIGVQVLQDSLLPRGKIQGELVSTS